MNVTRILLSLAVSSLAVSVASSQTFTVLHAFSNNDEGTNTDGAIPEAGLVQLNGVLCGNTAFGGLHGAGVIYYLNPDGSGFNAFHPLTNTPDASRPVAEMTPSGTVLFGTAERGGQNDTGCVFVGPTNNNGALLHSFAAVDPLTRTNLEGANPGAPVVLVNDVLYGTTTAGGFFGNGVVFSLTTNGATGSVLHHFTPLDPFTGTNADGATPWAGLVLSGDTLYGTASVGGTGGVGTIFSLNTNGNQFKTLYSFTSPDLNTSTNVDGSFPFPGLVLSNGVLYGAASGGGFGNSGTLFSLNTNGSNFTVLHQFTAIDGLTGTNADGANPNGNLMLAGGVLYGTALSGGTGAEGSIFSVRTNGTQFKMLYGFTPLNSSTNTDGVNPSCDLLLLNSALYGTTSGGGSGGAGTIFSLTLPTTVITNIVHNPDGSTTLGFLGLPNSTNIVQANAIVGSPGTWLNISTNVADLLGTWQFIDTNQLPMRFYRSLTP